MKVVSPSLNYITYSLLLLGCQSILKILYAGYIEISVMHFLVFLPYPIICRERRDFDIFHVLCTLTFNKCLKYLL